MALTIINDSLSARWVFYKAGGKVHKQWFKGNEVRTINEISSMTQLMNANSLRKFEITQRLPSSSPKHGLFDLGGNYFREEGPTGCVAVNVVSNTRSIQFNDNATNQYVNIPYSATQDVGTSDFTVSMWLYVPSSATTTQALFDQRNSSGTLGFSLSWLNIAGGRIGFNMFNGGSGQGFNTGGITTGVWHHFAVTVDRDSQTRSYLNGELVIESTNQTSFSAVSLSHASNGARLGYSVNNGNPFRGQLDEVILMKRALTPAQMVKLYNCGQAINPIAAFGDVVTWLRMGDGDTFPTITDQTGNSNGTMTNMSAADIITDSPQNPT